jgi:hypothetical protein
MKLAKLLSILILLSATCYVAGCKKDKKSGWDTEMLIPIATADLSIQNLVKGQSSVNTNPDNSLTLAFRNKLYEFSLADKVIDIPDTSIGQKFKLDSLGLPNQVIKYNFSLGLMATQMLSSPDAGIQFLGNYILSQNGNSAAIPAVGGFSSGLFQFDGTNYFQYVVLARGDISFAVNNYLPIPIQNVILVAKNFNSGTIIASDTIPYLAAGDSVFHIIDISGKTVEGSIGIQLLSLSTPGSGGLPVPIDTSDYIKLWISIANLRAADALARFPAQEIVNITDDIVQDLGDRRLTYIDARSGQLHVYITSSVEEQMYLEYTLVGAYDNYGNPLKAYTTVPPAPPNQTVTIDKLYDISGYAINLTGKYGTGFNTYTQNIKARIDSSGQLRHIGLDDSLIVRYEIINVQPNYIKGYAGRDTLAVIDTAAYSFLNMIQSGTLDLEDVRMNFAIENGIGVDGVVKINSLSAKSPTNGTRVLSGSILGQPLSVARATDFPLTPANSNFAVNGTNSNIKDLLTILPNELLYNIEVKTNPNGNDYTYRDFAYLESNLKVNLDAEIPLSLIATDLLLQDTIDFNLSTTNTNVAGIKDGVINVIAQNRYPINAELTMVIYDENWIAVDTLIGNKMIEAADLDASCRTNINKRTKIPVNVSEARMENIKRGRRAIITANFNTANSPTCNGQYLKIYSDYKLGITFTAKFNYKLETNF